eukprot:2857624-Rhodomonas_salina.3
MSRAESTVGVLPDLSQRMCLWACYAKSGIVSAYGCDTQCPVLSQRWAEDRATQCPVLTLYGPTRRTEPTEPKVEQL